ncbi:McrC family protein [Nocardia sp. NPDC127526]|uniref:McrC family protein n=1 Tax=Nocardia sp. NPDC127526 TaxID=3345393 RepID=UPI003633ECDC
MPEPIMIAETGPGADYRLSPDFADALNQSKLASARFQRNGLYRVKGNNKVGSAHIHGRDVHVAPKYPIRRVLFMLGYTHGLGERWLDDDVLLAENIGLVPAFAHPLCRHIHKALKPGVLRGYKDRDAESTVLRGRLRETDQLYRGHGMQTPLQIRYGDRTPDIPENQILLSALIRMLHVPGIDPSCRKELRSLQARLRGVTPKCVPLPKMTRLNMRYRTALELAELVLRQTSVDQSTKDHTVACNGFIVDMEDVFENFVRRTIGRHLQLHYGGWVSKPKKLFLDRGGVLKLEPDAVWQFPNDSYKAVVDAKYSAELKRGGGTPDHFYQVLAYCSRLGLPQGHLVYAKGHSIGRQFFISGSGIEIICHSLDLDQSPDDLLQDCATLAESIAKSAP